MKPPQSYIGVSGVCTRAEAEATLASFLRTERCDPCGAYDGEECGCWGLWGHNKPATPTVFRAEPTRLLMVGVLVSTKTLAGQRNRWWRRYPLVERIAGIFVDDPMCLNLVHYASDEPPDGDTLARLFELAGPLCHGFQFNGSWPLPYDLREIHRRFERAGRTPRIVLQLGSCHDGLGCDASADQWIARYVDRGRTLITDVLIDASGGTGKPLDVERARELIASLRSAFPSLGIGVAGGLCAEALPPVAPLLARGVSADAKGKLRDDADGGGRLVQEKVDAYIAAAGKASAR